MAVVLAFIVFGFILWTTNSPVIAFIATVAPFGLVMGYGYCLSKYSDWREKQRFEKQFGPPA